MIRQSVDAIEKKPFISGVGLDKSIQTRGDPSDGPGKLGHINVIIFAESIEKGFGRQLHYIKGLAMHTPGAVK